MGSEAEKEMRRPTEEIDYLDAKLTSTFGKHWKQVMAYINHLEATRNDKG